MNSIELENANLKDLLKKKEQRIAELEAQLEWRPIENMPDRSEMVILCEAGHPLVWLGYSDYDDECNPTHFIIIPEPPKEQES